MFLLDRHCLGTAQEDTGCQRGSMASEQPAEQLHLSVVTLGEIERGIEKSRQGDAEFADTLAAWLESLIQLYADRLLPVTPIVARRWGRLSAQLGHESADLLIAATALTYGLTVVTRIIGHFKPTGVRVLNPFSP